MRTAAQQAALEMDQAADLDRAAARYESQPADMLAWWHGDDEETNAEAAARCRKRAAELRAKANWRLS